MAQFEELERTIISNANTKTNHSRGRNYSTENNELLINRMSPDKYSRDSGILTPSEGGTNSGSRTSPEHDQLTVGSVSRNPSDPLPQAPSASPVKKNLNNEMPLLPVTAEIITTELNDPNQMQQEKVPPPYHIAASMSKHASDSKSIHLPSQDGDRQSSVNR